MHGFSSLVIGVDIFLTGTLMISKYFRWLLLFFIWLFFLLLQIRVDVLVHGRDICWCIFIMSKTVDFCLKRTTHCKEYMENHMNCIQSITGRCKWKLQCHFNAYECWKNMSHVNTMNGSLQVFHVGFHLFPRLCLLILL